MLYQVLARVSDEAAWEPFQAMTRDPLHAMVLLRAAHQRFAGVSIIQAESANLLREQVRRLRAGEPSGHEVSPVPSLTATPRLSPLGPTIESQRWAIEQGPGGDHDTPYHFEAPASAQTMARWARLMAAARRQDKAASSAVDPSDLSELAPASAESAAVEAEPSTVRSNHSL